MFGLPYNTVVVLFGASLLGGSVGLVGCFAILRGRALTGDALAHAALPGVCLGFLIAGERHLGIMLGGAFLVGLLGINCIAGLRRWTRVKEDAAIGFVLSVFFGAGVVLNSVIQRLPGTGSKAGLDSFYLGKAAGMSADDVYHIAAMALVLLLLVALLYKEFKLVTFDSAFAQVQGMSALALDLLLMAQIALAVVIGLPIVGVVMMAGLLIIPGVAARFWTERLGAMLLLSLLFGFLMGLVGSGISSEVAIPTGPIIILTGTAIFGGSLLAAPRRGLVSRILAQRRFQRDLDRRKLLRVLFDLSEPRLPGRAELALADLLQRRSWQPARLRRLLDEARAAGQVAIADGRYALTAGGLQRAAEVARGYRLWELFLHEYPDMALAADLTSESVEPVLPAAIVADLHAKLKLAGRWPRG
ncbi:MAG: metal ABC transporter permease [Planctomycetia bacterium]|nr:metal ABC transporter permease [Planctomycetia bacterium]